MPFLKHGVSTKWIRDHVLGRSDASRSSDEELSKRLDRVSKTVNTSKKKEVAHGRVASKGGPKAAHHKAMSAKYESLHESVYALGASLSDEVAGREYEAASRAARGERSPSPQTVRISSRVRGTPAPKFPVRR